MRAQEVNRHEPSGLLLAVASGMNMNSLIIAAGAARAHLYRTGHPNDVDAPVELIEIETLTSNESQSRTEPPSNDSHQRFAHRIAERAAVFAHDHFCNPVILTANDAISAELLSELEHELPRAYIRRIATDLSELDARELMRALQKEEAFAPRLYPMHV
jgi:protein required for attachment to host cells